MRLKRPRNTAEKGITLVELLVTVFVLSVGILSAMLFYTNAMRATEYGRDLTIATTHGEHVLEEMRLRPSLANITATNWNEWAQSEGIQTLPSETIAVSYVDPEADPLEITASVSWIKHGRQNSVQLTTRITR